MLCRKIYEEKGSRIAIIDLPGSGKSTFLIELGIVLNIPIHHLDQPMFEPNGKKKEKRELLTIEQAIVNEESWIVKGCSIHPRYTI